MANIVTVDCREQPIERVIVFNDRAEVKRLVSATLAPGNNEVHIQNLSPSLVHNSVRVDGTGNVVIHEVRTKANPALNREVDSPKLADLRTRLVAKQDESKTLTDKVEILKKRVEALDKLVVNMGTGILPKDGHLNMDGGVLDNITKFYAYYDEQAALIRSQLRETQFVLTKVDEEKTKLEAEFNNADFEHRHGVQNIFAITLESAAGGPVQLEVSYQLYSASWTPSYDFRVDTTGEQASIQVSYYGVINQTTGEDWNNMQLVLSTAQPCLGGDVPELGTVEVSFYRPPPPAPVVHNSGGGTLFGRAGPQMMMAKTATCEMAMDASTRKMKRAVCDVQEQALSTEYTIVRPTAVPSCGEATKVTIGIFELHPQIIHECVPSKSPSVFLTASAVNTSNLLLIVGPASVYLNNSFVTTTSLKNVSPGERFSCSLGVDTAVRVDYLPAKKYAQQTGIINTKSSIVTEQVTKVRNSRKTPVLLIVKESIPRSTDDKIQIRVLNPNNITNVEHEKHVGEAVTHKEGCVMNAKNNLEWTVKLPGGAVHDLVFKYAIEHPKEEKIEFNEKY